MQQILSQGMRTLSKGPLYTQATTQMTTQAVTFDGLR